MIPICFKTKDGYIIFATSLRYELYLLLSMLHSHLCKATSSVNNPALDRVCEVALFLIHIRK